MINLLIVDDQKHIRDGLQAMLRQFPNPPDQLYCAANGVEALELLREHPIQMVITDIRMPDMDGLELMERTKAERIQVEYLIISGYSDFAYAQQAIGLGAKGYLLKPVKREDLQTSVEQVIQEVQTRQALSSNMRHLTRRARETELKELRLFMQGASYDETWVRETEQPNTGLWLDYRLCLLREERRINQPGANNAHSMESVAYQVYGKKGCICLQHGPHLILAVSAAIHPAAFTAALQADALYPSMVMTGPYEGVKALPAAYNEVVNLYRHSYLFPDIRCLEPKHIGGLEQQWRLPYEKLYALFQLIGAKNNGQIAEGISALFHKDVLQRYHIQYTQQLSRAVVQLLEEYERVIRPYMGEEALDIDALRNLYDYPGIRDYLQALQHQLLRLNHFYKELKCSYRNTQDLNEAIRYIHENYHKPLDLAMVSNHVSLNYAYFSNLFKKNIGKGFAEYLRDVRLDKARRLLAETDYKIIDVTAMVGYESYKSFTRVFREVMDMQPTEYRLMMRQKQERERESKFSESVR